MSEFIVKGQELSKTTGGILPICEMSGDHRDMDMDFGLLRLTPGQVFEENPQLERAYLLVSGTVLLAWPDLTVTIHRRNCFDDSPWVLHVPGGVPVRITGVAASSDLTVHRTANDQSFPARLYEPQDTQDEYRGAGTMGETSTRIVRTVFDYSTAPWSHLVLGEVIGFPGKWSSYPPHRHPQPEIYHYRMLPENGFAYCDLGTEVLKVQGGDTVFITDGHIHPHVTAPGYALWYLWVIRHLEGNPYITPEFIPEHLWVTDKAAKFWPEE